MTAPLRILHVCQPDIGGVPQCVVDLASRQADDGHGVTVVAPPPVLDAVPARADLHLVAWSSSRSPVRGIRRDVRMLRHLVATSSPDVVHLHSAKAGLAGRLAVRGRTPTVFHPHAWSYQAVTGPAAAISRLWERTARRWTARFLLTSPAELAARPRGVAATSCDVVGNGVDVDLWAPPAPAARAATRARWNLGDRPTVLCVGRACPQKGQDWLVPRFDTVARAVPDALLLVVGPDTGVLERPTGDGDDAVRLVDGVSNAEIRDLMGAVDLVVLPSRWEGLPLTLLEAMATGRAVVATPVGGNGELAAVAGRVAPLGDDFLAAVVSLLGDDDARAVAGAAGRALVVDRYRLDDWSARVTAAYPA